MGIIWDSESSVITNFLDKIVVPIKDKSGQVISLIAWNYSDIPGEPKYAFPKNVEKELVGEVKEEVYLVEGIFDLITMTQIGLPAVCTLGISLKELAKSELRGASKVYILFDSDEAGRTASKKLEEELYPKTISLSLPDGHDPNSYYMEVGHSECKKYIEEVALTTKDILYRGIDELGAIESKRGKASIITNKLIPLIGRLPIAEQEVALAELAGKRRTTGIAKGPLREMLKLESRQSTEYKAEEVNLTTRLYMDIRGKVHLFKDTLGNAYCTIDIDGNPKMLKIDSTEFKSNVRKIVRTIEGEITSGEVVNSIIENLKADAICDGEEVSLENRVKSDGDAFYYDLSQEDESIAVIRDGDWEIIKADTPIFKRETHQKPQAEPKRDGNIRLILEIIPQLSADQELLYLVFLVAALIPDIPKPIMYVQGEKGAGKSDFSKMTRQLIDPSQIEGLKEPKIEDRVLSQLQHHYVGLFNNLNVMHHYGT